MKNILKDDKIESIIQEILSKINKIDVKKGFTYSNKVYKGIIYDYEDYFFKLGMKTLNGVKLPLEETTYSKNIETIKKDYYYARR